MPPVTQVVAQGCACQSRGPAGLTPNHPPQGQQCRTAGEFADGAASDLAGLLMAWLAWPGAALDVGA
jgi:hypothetical protein